MATKAIVTRLTPVGRLGHRTSSSSTALANALVPPMGKKALLSGAGVALKTTDGADTSSRGA